MGCSHPVAKECKACHGTGKGSMGYDCKVCEGKGKLCTGCGKPA